MSSRIRNTFAEARKKNVRPNWLQVDIWECLCAHWQTDEYKRIQEVDMAEALNRTVYLDEVFEQTHIKKSGGWVDDRSRMTHENFREKFSQHHSQHAPSDDGSGPSLSSPEEDRARLICWIEATGGEYKGRLYGASKIAPHIVKGYSLSQPPPNTSQIPNFEDIVQMRKSLQDSQEEQRKLREKVALLESSQEDQHRVREELAHLTMRHNRMYEALLRCIPPDVLPTDEDMLPTDEEMQQNTPHQHQYHDSSSRMKREHQMMVMMRIIRIYILMLLEGFRVFGFIYCQELVGL